MNQNEEREVFKALSVSHVKLLFTMAAHLMLLGYVYAQIIGANREALYRIEGNLEKIHKMEVLLTQISQEVRKIENNQAKMQVRFEQGQ